MKDGFNIREPLKIVSYINRLKKKRNHIKMSINTEKVFDKT
jgi:hypothetical protein